MGIKWGWWIEGGRSGMGKSNFQKWVTGGRGGYNGCRWMGEVLFGGMEF